MTSRVFGIIEVSLCLYTVDYLKRRVKASKAAKTVTTAAKVSKHACCGAKQGFGAPFRLALGSCSPGLLHQHVHALCPPFESNNPQPLILCSYGTGEERQKSSYLSLAGLLIVTSCDGHPKDCPESSSGQNVHGFFK